MSYTREQLDNFLVYFQNKSNVSELTIIGESEYDNLISKVKLGIKFKKASYTTLDSICFILIEDVEFEEPGLKQCNGENILFTSKPFGGSDLFIGNILNGKIIVDSSSER